MKTISFNKSLFLFALMTALAFSTFQKARAQPGVYVSHETFYHELSPYGQWINDRDFGRVWIPDVGRNFHPYMTNGHWVMTDYGNTWVSNYDWGWGPFHYGRWHFDDYYGWAWVPGNEWGPAWVAWRNGGGYYGWAPLGPRVNINVSVNIGRYIPNSYWSFVRYGHFTRRNIYQFCAPRPHITRIINQTTIINNTYVHNGRHTYYTGPETRHIERSTRQKVNIHRVNHVDRRGSTVVRNGEVNLYRPSSSSRGSRSNYDAGTSRSRGSADYRGRSSDVSRGRSTATPRSRGNVQERNSGTTRSYPSGRGTAESDRATRSRTVGTSGRASSGGNRDSYTPAQRGSRSNSSQQYGNSRESTATRGRNSRSIERTSPSRSSDKNVRSGSSRSSYQRGGRPSQRSGSVERTSRQRSSGSTNSSRGSSTYQRQSRSPSPAVNSRASERSESSSRSRSTRSSRGGGN